MSNKEKCLSLLNEFSDAQLANIAVLLESVKTLTEETAEDSYCLRLYADYQTSADKGEPISLDDFAKSLGLNLQ